MNKVEVQKVIIVGYPIDQCDRRDVEELPCVWRNGRLNPDVIPGVNGDDVVVYGRDEFENLLNEGSDCWGDENIDNYWWKIITCIDDTETLYE